MLTWETSYRETAQNKSNLDKRENKMRSSIAAIFSIAKSEILKQMEMRVLCELFEVVTIPGIIFNCEAWELTKTEIQKLEKMQLWALKKILGVPRTTPSAAVIFSTGSQLMETRIYVKQLKFLRKNSRPTGR